VLASCCAGTAGPLAKSIMDAGVRPEQLAAARIGLSALLLLVVVGLARPALLRVRRVDRRLVLGYGLFGVAAVQLLYFATVARIPVGIATLLEFTSPVLVALWVRFGRGTVLPARAWAGTGLALGGLALMARVWDGLTLDAVGLLLGVGTALAAASYFLLGERAVGTVAPLGLVTWGMVAGAAAIMVVVPPWTLPVSALGSVAEFGPWHPPVWTLVLVIVGVSTTLAYLCGISSMRHLPSTVVSVVGLTEPAVATGVAWAFLGQSLSVVQVIGAAVMLGGAALVQWASSAVPDNRCPPTI
jgi:drug/metabolite transporter (DMT)-like permease